jgi:hypothetical protein
MSTFKQMHPPKESKDETHFPTALELTPVELSQEKVPRDDSFVLCLPKTIPGFDMNKKEWSLDPDP